ncbi:hypothetical protein EHS39_36320 [Ensifer sp. MPMI2T]|nr:hypothetical protein EHS39_36320 [Ensifer sp. MPMI2T]
MRHWENAKSILIARLDAEDFGSDAACALVRIHQGNGETQSEKRGFRHWIDFDRAMSARANRQLNPDETSEESEAIFASVRRLAVFGTERETNRAIELAGWGAMLPHGNKADVFEDLLGRRLPSRAQFTLHSRMFLGGHLPNHKQLLEGLCLFFKEHERDLWSVEREPWEILQWLELFPHSDRPESLFDALDIVQQNIMHPIRWRMDGLFTSLKKVNGPIGLHMLRRLAEREPRHANEYSWYQALLAFSPVDVLDILVDISEGKIPSDRGMSGAGYGFTTELAYLLLGESDGLERLAIKFASASTPASKALLARVMVESGDADLFIALINDSEGRAYLRRRLHSNLQEVAYRRDPPLRGNGTYELIPVDASRVRAALFHLTIGEDDDAAEFAKVCLDELEVLRADYGRADTEPRHPDISLGVPWPNPI